MLSGCWHSSAITKTFGAACVRYGFRIFRYGRLSRFIHPCRLLLIQFFISSLTFLSCLQEHTNGLTYNSIDSSPHTGNFNLSDNFHINFHPRLNFHVVSFPLALRTTFTIWTPIFFHICHKPDRSNLLSFNLPSNIWRRLTSLIMHTQTMQLSPFSNHFLALRTKCSPQIPALRQTEAAFLHLIRETTGPQLIYFSTLLSLQSLLCFIHILFFFLHSLWIEFYIYIYKVCK